MTNAKSMLQAIEANQLDQADLYFKQALAQDDADTLFSLAEELYALGFLEQAQQVYLQLLKQFPQEDQLKTVLADIAVSNGDYDAAIDYLDQIKETSPAYAESLLTAADVYQTMGFPEVSEQKLLQAVRLYPDEPVIQFALGELYFEQGEYLKAAGYYEALLDTDVLELGQVNIKQRLAISYASNGAFEEALTLYEELPIELLSEDDQFQIGFLYLQIKDYEKAIKQLTALQERDPQYTSLYVYLATAQAAINQLEDALATVKAGIALDTYQETLYQKGSELAQKLGDDSTAEGYLKAALKLNPDNIGNILALSQLYLRQHRHAENITLLMPLVTNEKPVADSYWQLAQSQAATNQLESAQENYLLAYPDLKESATFMHDLVRFFQLTSQQDALKAAVKQYLKLVPTDDDMQALWHDLTD